MKIIQIIKASIRIFFFLIAYFTILTAISQNQYRKANEAKGLEIGAQVEDFSAIDLFENTYVLSDQLKNGPVVIIFYRGQWCPICNRHLSNLQDSLQLIYDKGASVVAISPEKPEFLKRTAEKTKAQFSLLYDEGYKISDAFDLTFKPGILIITMYNTMLGANLKNAHSDDSQRLPIPATYIIGQDGKVIWRHFDPDYKNRSDIKDIVDVLGKL